MTTPAVLVPDPPVDAHARIGTLKLVRATVNDARCFPTATRCENRRKVLNIAVCPVQPHAHLAAARTSGGGGVGPPSFEMVLHRALLEVLCHGPMTALAG